MNISIIGGDLRIVRLAEMYAKEGKQVYTYGLEKYFDKNTTNGENIDNDIFNMNETSDKTNDIVVCRDMEQAINSSKIIISGMPFSSDKVTVNAPFSRSEIGLDELKGRLSYSSKVFIAGGIPKEFENEKFETIDLLKNEKLTILNAIPTVEGAIKIAIEEREETIHGSNVIVCGFGRIGKILCRRFKALGANVYCVARKDTDWAWIREEKYIPLKYDEICKYGKKFDILINTVPTTVINEKELSEFKKDILLIELASKPGGIDQEAAKRYDLKTVVALGIPGKIMPKTAAKHIKEIVDEKIAWAQLKKVHKRKNKTVNNLL